MKDTNGQEMNDPKRNQAPQSEPAERPQETQFGQEFSEEVGVNDVNREESGYPNEQKDARGGNHNPKGANQYTSGRVDDRGRKGKEGGMETKGAEQNNGNKHANQYTEGRNDDRGRKE